MTNGKGEKMNGCVIWFDSAKGYGFVKASTTGDEYFTHFSVIECEGYKSLKKDDAVEFTVGMGPKGKIQVESVRLVKQMPVGTGSLFEDEAKGRFLGLTGSRYDSMKKRIEKKKMPPLKFSKDDYRDYILKAMGGKYDGFIQCRYCTGFFGITDVASDHEIPLSRGGDTDLNNIGFPCSSCNSQKGSMKPLEFEKFRAFLEKEIPLARQDVLSRLEKAVKLAAGAFATQGVIKDLKTSGAWQEAQRKRTAAKREKEHGLGKF